MTIFKEKWHEVWTFNAVSTDKIEADKPYCLIEREEHCVSMGPGQSYEKKEVWILAPIDDDGMVSARSRISVVANWWGQEISPIKNGKMIGKIKAVTRFEPMVLLDKQEAY